MKYEHLITPEYINFIKHFLVYQIAYDMQKMSLPDDAIPPESLDKPHLLNEESMLVLQYHGDNPHEYIWDCNFNNFGYVYQYYVMLCRTYYNYIHGKNMNPVSDFQEEFEPNYCGDIVYKQQTFQEFVNTVIRVDKVSPEEYKRFISLMGYVEFIDNMRQKYYLAQQEVIIKNGLVDATLKMLHCYILYDCPHCMNHRRSDAPDASNRPCEVSMRLHLDMTIFQEYYENVREEKKRLPKTAYTMNEVKYRDLEEKTWKTMREFYKLPREGTSLLTKEVAEVLEADAAVTAALIAEMEKDNEKAKEDEFYQKMEQQYANHLATVEAAKTEGVAVAM